MNQLLFIRADANSQIGTGHLMRCLALAQAWQLHRGAIKFITACDNERLRQRLLDEGFQVITLDKPYRECNDLHATLQLLGPHSGACIVVDGYHFDSTYYSLIREAGYKLLAIDDMAHLDHYDVDLLLNQNINAEELSYNCRADTDLLLGTRYSLLRSEFLTWQSWKREIPKIAKRILLTLGGSDSENVTPMIIRVLQRLNEPNLEVKVIVGSANPHLNALSRLVASSNDDIQLLASIKKMSELMAWADMAISAGGSTCWELAFMGLPNLIIIQAENQEGIAEGLQNKGVALNLGWYTTVTETALERSVVDLMYNTAKRQKMSQQGRRLVDGNGRTRVVTALRRTSQ